MRFSRLINTLVCLTISYPALSFDVIKDGRIPLQLGVFNASQGKAQDINIQDLIGNRYTVTNGNDQNLLFGLGYFIDGYQKGSLSLAYGVNGFYFAKTTVKGHILQEHLFDNLSYRYKVTHIPVYAAAKAEINNNSQNYALTFDAGIGPNFMNTSKYQENSLDGGVTLPDRAFSGKSTTVFSAMAGVGIKVNQAFGQIPLECGYRFFYLGKGEFNNQNSQILNNLETGNNYAHAIICAITL